MGFCQQEYLSGLPLPPPRDLPDPGIEPASPTSPALQVASLPTELSGKPQPRRNRQIFRKVQSRKTEPGKIENMNRSITSNEMESVI